MSREDPLLKASVNRQLRPFKKRRARNGVDRPYAHEIQREHRLDRYPVGDGSSGIGEQNAFLERLNRRLRDVIAREGSFEFITAFYLVIDTADGSVSYATAGHHPPLLMQAGSHRARRLFDHGELKGPALMLVHEPRFSIGEGRLEPGDRILLFTDGLTEMPSAPSSDEDLGTEGLIQTLDGVRPENLANLVGGIASAVLDLSGAKAFEDDLCLIGIEYRNPHEGAWGTMDR